MYPYPLAPKFPNEVPFGTKNPKEGVMLQFDAKMQKREKQKCLPPDQCVA